MNGCFRDPAVVGCVKGVLGVGVVFVPGGAAVRGGELAVAGGARLIEGEVGAGSLAFAANTSREEAKAAEYDRAGLPADAQPDAAWTVGDDVARRGAPGYRYDAKDRGAHGNCEQFETEGGSRVIAEHTNDPNAPRPHFHAGQPKVDATRTGVNFGWDSSTEFERYSQVGGKHHILLK
ncbi:HNH/endonuclease VII fold putative polymorphic toxin [Amycolatopsis sp. WGS_07]|uniref:HNH/endonuclease VII fold putative polymorphic toxin n=1 Tax=Amycolatopsis sp. WGS_07 TaxID=3076764 RepID=UPI0038734B16